MSVYCLILLSFSLCYILLVYRSIIDDTANNRLLTTMYLCCVIHMWVTVIEDAMNPIHSTDLLINKQPVTVQPVWLPLLIFCSHADLLPQAARLKHQQAAWVRPSDHPIRCEPGVTQEVELFHLGKAALLQRSLCVAEQLEHSKSTDAKLRVVKGVEADLNGQGRKKSIHPFKGARVQKVIQQRWNPTWLTTWSERLVDMVVKTLFFSQNHNMSSPSDAPDWLSKYLESGEKAMQTNSWTETLAADRTFLFLPCSCCRSKTVMVAFSPHSDTAR